MYVIKFLYLYICHCYIELAEVFNYMKVSIFNAVDSDTKTITLRYFVIQIIIVSLCMLIRTSFICSTIYLTRCMLVSVFSIVYVVTLCNILINYNWSFHAR